MPGTCRIMQVLSRLLMCKITVYNKGKIPWNLVFELQKQIKTENYYTTGNRKNE